MVLIILAKKEKGVRILYLPVVSKMIRDQDHFESRFCGSSWNSYTLTFPTP